MKDATETKINNIIREIDLTDPISPKIEDIADRFPEEYESNDEYVDFQQDIAELVIQHKKEKTEEIKTELAKYQIIEAECTAQDLENIGLSLSAYDDYDPDEKIFVEISLSEDEDTTYDITVNNSNRIIHEEDSHEIDRATVISFLMEYSI